MATSVRINRAENLNIAEKLARFHWPLFAAMLIVLVLSVATLYSIGRVSCADQTKCVYEFGSWQPWAASQLFRIMAALAIFFAVALTNIKFLIRFSYPIFFVAVLMVIAVSFVGHTGMGAQRWLDLGIINIQPSEFIKITLILVLARYFSWMNSVEVHSFKNFLAPLAMLVVPFVLVMMQPDLGTALTLMIIVAGIFFIVGLPRIWFVIAFAAALITAPIAWTFFMHDYQKDRILVFINPSEDSQGKGYQINQSKITLGSGGFLGKGYIKGSQAQLNFLPEKQTDFIFTVFGEQFGFIGGAMLVALYMIIMLMIYFISKSSKNRFGQLLCFGFMINFFVYFFVNMAMVMGMMPIVGVPLPLMSFGGSSLMALLFGFGLVQNAYIHKDMQLSSKGN